MTIDVPGILRFTEYRLVIRSFPLPSTWGKVHYWNSYIKEQEPLPLVCQLGNGGGDLNLLFGHNLRMYIGKESLLCLPGQILLCILLFSFLVQIKTMTSHHWLVHWQVKSLFFSFLFSLPSFFLRGVLNFQTPISFTDTFSGKGRTSLSSHVCVHAWGWGLVGCLLNW